MYFRAMLPTTTVALCLILFFWSASADEQPPSVVHVASSDPHLKGSLEMVPVSSTVIPIQSLFGTQRPSSSQSETTGVGSVGQATYPIFRRNAYSRRSNFFHKSTKPGTPVRLITTRSNRARVEAYDG